MVYGGIHAVAVAVWLFEMKIGEGCSHPSRCCWPFFLTLVVCVIKHSGEFYPLISFGVFQQNFQGCLSFTWLLRAPGALDSVEKYVIRPTSRLISSLPVFGFSHIYYLPRLSFRSGSLFRALFYSKSSWAATDESCFNRACYNHDSCWSPVYKHAILILVAKFPHDAHKSHRSIVLGTSVFRSPCTHSLSMMSRNLQNRPHRDHQPTDATSQFCQQVHANRSVRL